MTQETWLADLGRAAESLGYGIVAIEPARIELSPFRGHDEIIVVRGRLLSGDLLRKYLRNHKGDWMAPALPEADPSLRGPKR